MEIRRDFPLPMQGVHVCSLVGELRSQVPCSQRNKNKRSNIVTNSIQTLKMVHSKKIKEIEDQEITDLFLFIFKMNISFYYNHIYIFFYMLLARPGKQISTAAHQNLTSTDRLLWRPVAYATQRVSPAPCSLRAVSAAPTVGRSGGCTRQGQGKARSLPARCPARGTAERTPSGSPHPPPARCHES